MAKELPYFKFNCSEWISGNITLEDLTTQGAFINICAYYWFKSGCITLTEIKRRLKLKQPTIDSLIKGNHIKVTDDLIEISFLLEQFNERGHISKRNSLNGSKGGAPKGNKNAEKNNREQAKTTNIEKEKEEEKEQNKKEIQIEKNFEWFLKQFDEMFAETLKMTHKGKDFMQAAKESYAHLSADPIRLKMAENSDCKKLLNTWLTNQKNNKNGTEKLKSDISKGLANIAAKYGDQVK